MVLTPSRTCERSICIDNRGTMQTQPCYCFRSMLGRTIRIGGAAAARIRSAPPPFSCSTCIVVKTTVSHADGDTAAATARKGAELQWSMLHSTPHPLALQRSGPIQHHGGGPYKTRYYLGGLVRHFDSILKDVRRKVRAWLGR